MIHLSEDILNPDGEADEADVLSVPRSAVPEKFRGNPAAGFEAYGNLEREFHATKQELKAYQQNYQTLSEQNEQILAAQQAAAAPAPADELEALADQFGVDYDTAKLMKHLVEQTSQSQSKSFQQQAEQQLEPLIAAQREQSITYAENMLRQKLPDWGEYGPQVGAAIMEQRWLLPDDSLTSPNTAAQRLEAIYHMVKGKDLGGKVGTIDLAAAAEAQAQRIKEQSQTMSGVSGRPSSPDEFEQRWNQIQNADTTNARSILGG